MKVLGVDPGSRVIGYAILDTGDELLGFGEHSFHKKEYLDRFITLEATLDWIFQVYPNIDEVAVEQAVRFRDRKIAELEVAVRIIKKWAQRQKKRIGLYYPATWKAGVTGKSKATKDNVARIVCLHFPQVREESDHVTDAIAIGMYHRARRKTDLMVEATAQGKVWEGEI